MCRASYGSVFGWVEVEEALPDEDSADDEEDLEDDPEADELGRRGMRVGRWEDIDNVEEDPEFGRRGAEFLAEVAAPPNWATPTGKSRRKPVEEEEEDAEGEEEVPVEPSVEAAKSHAALLRPAQAEAVVAPRAQEGPFGLAPGMSRSALLLAGAGSLEPNGFVYAMTQLPRPHPSIASLTMFAGTKGLARIVGSTRPFALPAPGGADTDSSFENLRKGLSVKYGFPSSIDGGSAGSGAITGSSRLRALRWPSQNGAALPGAIEQITLRETVSPDGHGVVELTYTFDNWDACEAELRAAGIATTPGSVLPGTLNNPQRANS